MAIDNESPPTVRPPSQQQAETTTETPEPPLFSAAGNPAKAFVALISSRKGQVALLVIVGVFVAFFIKRIAWEQAENLLRWVLGFWMTAQAGEDIAKHVATGKVAVAKAQASRE